MTSATQTQDTTTKTLHEDKILLQAENIILRRRVERVENAQTTTDLSPVSKAAHDIINGLESLKEAVAEARDMEMDTALDFKLRGLIKRANRLQRAAETQLTSLQQP